MSRDAIAPYRAIGFIPSGTTAVAAYTATKFVNVQAIRVANVTGSAATCTLSWYDASETTVYTLIYQKSIAANDVLQIEVPGFQLAQNDEIRITAGTASALHVLVTIVEVPGRSG